ncbi:uncharacterized protein LOC133204785 [Saccostrea echinata]|uniref:uncharacterized protein LOC133204785 n=1 Tax=Saccostrea echinata TaxID=191078 RepID=UPI002A824A5F|nr:uncharacterized protein LOC133204785 [Saccostrea echinata]
MGLTENGYFLSLSLFPVLVQAEDNTSSADYPKILTPIIVSFGALILAFTVAKLVDCCCKKTLERNENLESLDDNTKKILRARLIVIQMKRKEMAKVAPTLGFLKRWSTRSKVSKNLQIEATQKGSNKQTVITVEEASEKEKKNNSALGGFLKQNKVSNGIPNLTNKNQKQHNVYKQNKSDSLKGSKSETPTPTSGNATSGNNSSLSQVSSPKSVPSSELSNQTSGISKSDSDPRRPSGKSVTFNENVEVKTEDEIENKLDSVKVVNETPTTDSNKPSNLKKPS